MTDRVSELTRLIIVDVYRFFLTYMRKVIRVAVVLVLCNCIRLSLFVTSLHTKQMEIIVICIRLSL